MLNILPFEIISRNTKTLLITYISSVDISHEGMKKILESLHTQRGIIPESYLDELLDYESIDKDKGKEFLVTTGVINKTKEVAIKWSAAPDMTPQTVLYRRPVAQFSNFQPKIVSSWLILALFQANFLISGRSRLCPYQLVNSNQVRQGE